MASMQGLNYYTKDEIDEVEQLTIETLASVSTPTVSLAYRYGKVVTINWQAQLSTDNAANKEFIRIKDSNGNVIPVKCPIRFGIGQASSQYSPQENAFGWVDANGDFRIGYASTAGQWITVVLTFIIVQEEESE